MKKTNNSLALFIHVHAICSILGQITFFVNTNLASLFMTVGFSSSYVAFGFWLSSATFPRILVYFLVVWSIALPLLMLVFYFLFLLKRKAVPYLVIAGIDTLIVVSWVLSAILFQNWYGAMRFCADAIISLVIYIVMIRIVRKTRKTDGTLGTLS